MKAANTDAIGVLRWGLRKYRALFSICVLLGGAVLPLLAAQRTTAVEAEALITPQQLQIDLAALPRFGETVFDSGDVAQAVGSRFGDLGDYEEVIPNRVYLIAEQDSIVFRVVGVDPDPRRASDIANVAAEAFIAALNAPGAGVGSFALQSPAEPPAQRGGLRQLVLPGAAGLAAGLVLGLAVVSLLLVARRPVIAATDAEDTTGVPVLGTVTVPRTPAGQEARPEDFAGLIPACRRLLSLPTPTIVVVSQPTHARMRTQVSTALARILVRVRDVRFIGPSDVDEIASDRTQEGDQVQVGSSGWVSAGKPLTLIDSSEPLDLVQPPQSTAAVLVVPEGVSSAGLRAAVVEHLGGSAEARLLLVRRGRRVRGRPTSSGQATEAVPESGTTATESEATATGSEATATRSEATATGGEATATKSEITLTESEAPSTAEKPDRPDTGMDHRAS